MTTYDDEQLAAMLRSLHLATPDNPERLAVVRRRGVSVHRRWTAGLGSAALCLALVGGATVVSRRDQVVQVRDNVISLAATRTLASSSRWEASVEIGGSAAASVGGLPGFKMNGAFDYQRRVGVMTFAFGSFGSAEMRLVDEVAYMRLSPELAKSMPSAKPWMRLTVPKAALNQMGGSDPLAFLDDMRDVSGSPRYIDTEVIRGVETTHYRFDGDGYDRYVKSAMDDALGDSAASGMRGMRMTTKQLDVWTDADELIRRVDTLSEMAVPATAGGHSLTTRTRMEFFDFGLSVSVTAPPADQVSDVDFADLLKR